MAVHELRRFNFFDLNTDSDKGVVGTLLKDAQLKVATSGHGNFILCDSEGNIHILNKNFKATTFRGYAVTTTLAEYIKHSPFLVTVGEDEAGVNPLLKVWNTEKLDKNGNPTCVRVTRLSPGHKAVQPTCICCHEGMNLLAVGFQDGSLLLFRGDLTRDRSSKPKLLKESGTSVITGLAFRTSAKYYFLFVTSTDHVFFYDVSSKDKEIKIHLDSIGCLIGCSIMAESPHGANFVVGRKDAVYCYTTDGKGPCYAVEGEKILIQWSKTYLVIVSKEEAKAVNNFRPAPDTSTPSENHVITILDIQNKLIVFSTSMKPILAVLVEWGSFYIVTKDHKIHHLGEKDVQSKLALLFKKNLYDVAIRMAKSQHYDEEGLVDIFRQYGDHLYAKGDRFGAIEQYIKTIGKLEPSYIIRKFMDSAHMEQLTEYLQALHRAGLASGDHTTLLLNCYTKLGRTTDLKNFIMTKDRELDFDIEIALKVVRGVNPDDALQLAKAHKKHLWVLRILLEDQKKYEDAIVYISGLDLFDAEKCMLDFGDILINNAPEATTVFLKSFCTDSKFQVSGIGSFDPVPGGIHKARPQDYLHLFLNKSEYLVEFLEHLVQSQTGWSTQIYNALVEHYLVVWSKSEEGNRSQIEQRLMKLLQNPDAMYDRDQTFILCKMYNFSPGIVLLYEENKMYHQVIQYHMNQGNYKAVLATCKRYGHQDPYLWVQALWSVAREPDAPAHLLPDILQVIEKEKLLSPLLTVEALGDTPATLGQARKYLSAVLQAEEELVSQERALIEKYSSETEKIKTHIHDIQTNPMIFQGSRCSVCQRQLELPSIHFLCQHSYHQHCFQSYSDNENECIACRSNNKQLLDMIKSQEQNHELHEAFHSQLEKSDDGFSIVADYFGRGVFNTVAMVPPDGSAPLQRPPIRPQPEKAFSKPPEVISKPAELSLPSKKEQTESKRKSPNYEMMTGSVSGRLEANLATITPTEERPANRLVSEISPITVDPACNNPFEEEYDETKNPFADEEEDTTNPFSSKEDTSDYDKHLNPFA